jgi:hypothetical protein
MESVSNFFFFQPFEDTTVRVVERRIMETQSWLDQPSSGEGLFDGCMKVCTSCGVYRIAFV